MSFGHDYAPNAGQKGQSLEHWGNKLDDSGHYRVFTDPCVGKKLQSLLVLDNDDRFDTDSVESKEEISKSVTPLKVLAPATKRHEASWRRMLITQPAIMTLLLDSRISYHHHVVKADANAGGITMGRLLDVVLGFRGMYRIPGNSQWETWESNHDLHRITVSTDEREAYAKELRERR